MYSFWFYTIIYANFRSRRTERGNTTWRSSAWKQRWYSPTTSDRFAFRRPDKTLSDKLAILPAGVELTAIPQSTLNSFSKLQCEVIRLFSNFSFLTCFQNSRQLLRRISAAFGLRRVLLRRISSRQLRLQWRLGKSAGLPLRRWLLRRRRNYKLGLGRVSRRRADRIRECCRSCRLDSSSHVRKITIDICFILE